MTKLSDEFRYEGPTAEISLETVKKRAVVGVGVLSGRTLISNVISVVAQGFLWLFIEPAEFGVFLLVSATVNFLSYFADIGLGAALIQKKEEPQKEDYDTVFITQEVLVLSVVLIVFLVSPILTSTHSLSNEGKYLLYALNFSFFLASLKNIPSIMLERKLEFGKFVIPQILENIVYSVSTVFFAWKGYGVSTFTYSVIIRGLVGVIAMYVIQPWKPGFKFSKISFSQLVHFGIPFQLNSFLATIKDDGITIVLGGILGSYALGILGTARKLAQYPLRFFLDPVTKVTFPAFSRTQHDPENLSKFFSKSVFFICCLVFPIIFGLIILFPDIITVIPKYEKWRLAYVPLILVSIDTLWAAPTTQMTNVLASIGKIKLDLKFMLMWTSLTWLLVPLLARYGGLNGTALAYAVVSCSSVVVYFVVRKYVKWSILESTFVPLISSLVMSIFLLVIKRFILIDDLVTLILFVILGGSTYFGILYILTGKKLLKDVEKILSGFKKE